MKNIKALIVDDELVVREFLVRLLSLRGVEAKAVEDGPAAIKISKEEAFDIVLIDIKMPKMGGVDVLRELKQIRPGATYVMITGYLVDDLLKQAQEIGALTSLKKPFDISYIISLVNNLHSKEPSKPLNILVLDDDKSVRDFFRMLFKYRNYNVVIVETVKDAMEKVIKSDFDLVFVDAILKDGNGLEVSREIKKIKPDLRIILMSGYLHDVKDILDSGAEVFLGKPFQIEKIFNEIDKVIQ
ncbi:MAG: response regulator [Candidatus Omnitrophota bacterium]|nr:response regulator [Candidatus Omnitrophota bacterium]MBU1928284.1 response regulator [Candidatus Omnitrophota bacterium]MBU2035560.1 response regulator [Candidatus Omnitrophota bacterium]MBU2257661.1 response regulator [Candidatus Omnitrophota bacterium]